jgi:2-polyprenyl-3-methyl-5-hydroxy-6-metoxy-1,4-benzoquinol methylase
MGKYKCPICSADKSKLLFKKNGYQILICTICTHHYALIRSDECDFEDPKHFIAYITNNTIFNPEEYFNYLSQGEKTNGHIYNIAEKIFALTDKFCSYGMKSWLDIGCGSGFLLSRLQEKGWNAIGIEPGEWGQIAARRRGINVIQGFLDKKTFNRKFDVISAVDVLEHIPDPIHFMDLANYYLNKGGRMVITIPFADSFNAKVFKRYWSMIEPPSHSQYFTTRSLNRLLIMTGFEIETSVCYNVQRLPFFRKFEFFNNAYDFFTNRILGMDQRLLILRKNVLL